MPNALHSIAAALSPPPAPPPPTDHGGARVPLSSESFVWTAHACQLAFCAEGKNSTTAPARLPRHLDPPPDEEERTNTVHRAATVRIAVVIASLASYISADGYINLRTDDYKRPCKICAPFPLTYAPVSPLSRIWYRLPTTPLVRLRSPIPIFLAAIPSLNATAIPNSAGPSPTPRSLSSVLSVDLHGETKMHAEPPTYTALRSLNRRLHPRRGLAASPRGWVPASYVHIRSHPCPLCVMPDRRRYRRPHAPRVKVLMPSLLTNTAPPIISALYLYRPHLPDLPIL